MKSKELRDKCNEIKTEVKRAITEMLASHGTNRADVGSLSSTPIIIDNEDGNLAYTLDSVICANNGKVVLGCSSCSDCTNVTDPDTDVLIAVLECLEENEDEIFDDDGSPEDEKPGFASRLEALGAEAFTAAKDKLKKMGGKFVLKAPHTLYVDLCDDGDSLTELEARKVILRDNNLVILARMDDGEEDALLKGDLEWCPDRIWTEGGQWYIEWEGLFEVIDQLLEA